LLSFSRLLEQSQLFFQWQLDPGFAYNNPDTIDSGLKLNFATGPNIVQIGNRFWERHLKLAGHPTHDPYSRKESFLVKIESSLFPFSERLHISSSWMNRRNGAGDPARDGVESKVSRFEGMSWLANI
jgi:hypothetical protein